METYLMLCLLLIANMTIAVPITERRDEYYFAQQDRIIASSGDKFSDENRNEYTTEDDTHVPHYMTALYECWQKKDKEQEMKNCLRSVDEILEIDEIVNSTNTITGFIGQGVPSNENITVGPQYQQIMFNLSSVRMHDDLLSSELRFYKEGIDVKTLQTLTSEICPLSDKGAVLSLLVDLNLDGQDHLIQSINLSINNLLNDKWIVFYNLRYVFSELIHSHNFSRRNGTFKLVLQGGCAGIHPEEIGFRFKEDPLLVVFLNGQDPSVDEHVMKEISTKMAAQAVETRKKRQIDTEDRHVPKSPFCQLHYYNVNFTTLGYNEFIIGPKEYQANYCAGMCSYPLSDHQNGTLHSQLIALAHQKEPDAVPGPCCVPTEFQSKSLIVKYDKFVIQIKTYPKMIAKHCGCR